MDKRWLIAINISAISTFVFLGASIVSPILPKYALMFNVPIALTGWAISAFFMSKILLDLPAGIISDVHPRLRKKMMIIGLIILAIFSAVSGMAPTYLILVFARAMSGVGAALYLTNAAGWLAHFSRGPDRRKIMGFYYGFVVIGTSAGPGIGGLIAAQYGIRAPFYFYSLMVVLGVVFTIPLPEVVSENKVCMNHFRLSTIKKMFSNKPFILISLSTLIAFIITSGVRNTLFPLYASVNLGLRTDQIGLLMTVGAVANGFLALPSGWLSERVGRKALVVSSFATSSLLTLFLYFQKDINGLLFYNLMQGLSNGLQAQIMPWFADLGDHAGIVMGLYRLVQDLGSFLGPIIITNIIGYCNPNLVTLPPFLFSSIVAMVAAMIILKVD